MEKQLGWACKLDGGSRDLQGRSVFARLMDSQIWHQFTNYAGGRLSKEQWPLFNLILDTSVSHLYTTGAFQAATLVLELRGSKFE